MSFSSIPKCIVNRADSSFRYWTFCSAGRSALSRAISLYGDFTRLSGWTEGAIWQRDEEYMNRTKVESREDIASLHMHEVGHGPSLGELVLYTVTQRESTRGLGFWG